MARDTVRISDLQQQLSEVRRLHGDLEVVVVSGDVVANVLPWDGTDLVTAKLSPSARFVVEPCDEEEGVDYSDHTAVAILRVTR